MENDEMGRWARVAYAGKFGNIGFYRGKVCRWEIAWIKKVDKKFYLLYYYPSNGKRVFDTVQDAKKEVSKTFKWFLKMCAGATVASSAAGQNGSDGVMKWCDSCGKITKWIDGDCENYKTRGGSAKEALPR
jgi:hypothetical protein